VADRLYRDFPDADEGWLSRARASIVRATALAEAAEELGLGDEVRLGKGEEATGGREKPSILSDALEAVIGAVYLDGGRDAAADTIELLLGSRLNGASGEPGHLDDKSRLQEYATGVLRQAVHYDIADSGPEHDKTFNATARVGGKVWGEGVGRSKKQAEQIAARTAYAALVAEHGEPEPPTPPERRDAAAPDDAGSAHDTASPRDAASPHDADAPDEAHDDTDTDNDRETENA